MSDPLRVALVAEGPTDGVVIEGAIRAMLGDRSFVLTQLFPEARSAGGFGPLGSGWGGVYRWCHQATALGQGRLQGHALLFLAFDLIIFHLDADVAGCSYQDDGIDKLDEDLPLPCELPCPPASDTADALRMVLLSWLGESMLPDRAVICMPSKNTEAWVLAALFPNDRVMAIDLECFSTPETRFGQQNKATRIRKSTRDYLNRSKDFEAAWPRISSASGLTEAGRFRVEFLARVPRN